MNAIKRFSKRVRNSRAIEFIFNLFCSKYSILPFLIIIIAYPFIGTEINSKGCVSEWAVFLIYIIFIIFPPGYIYYRRGFLLRGLFVWGMGALVFSIGIVKAALPSYEHGCLIQWLSSFMSSPWTMSLGKITEHREILLWSPGLFFAVFVGIISILGYEASKKARDILLKRISSHNIVFEIGQLIDDKNGDSRTGKTETDKIEMEMIVASPLIGQLVDPEYFNKHIKDFWKSLIESDKNIRLNILCLTDISASEYYEKICDQNEFKDKYEESKKCCNDLKGLQNNNTRTRIVKIKRRDNLPLVRMVIIRTRKTSKGIFFMEVPPKRNDKTDSEVQGFQTEDPAVIDILSRIFKIEFESDEPITRIGVEQLPTR